MSDLIAYTTYCESIRNEVNGQYSLVGVFRGGIGVPEFPSLLAQFGIVISVFEKVPEGASGVEGITYKVLIPGHPEESPFAEGAFEAVASVGPYVFREAHMTLSPLPLIETGNIGVRLFRNGELLMRLRALPIGLNEQSA